MKMASPVQCLVVALLASPTAGMTMKALSARSLAAARAPDPSCSTGILALKKADKPQTCCAGYCGECTDYPTCSSVRGMASQNACCASEVYNQRCGGGAAANVCVKKCSEGVPPCIMDNDGGAAVAPAAGARNAADDCGDAVKNWRMKAEAAVKAVDKPAAAGNATAAAEPAAATPEVAKKEEKTCPKPTYTLAGVPLTSPKRGELTTATFPSDFCADFDLTLPAKENDNKHGYEGTIAMMGQLDIVVTHTKKLLSGTGFGLMAIIQSDGNGPYFATVGFADPGRRIAGTFCYKASTNEPSFTVDKKKVQADYLHNKGKPFPSDRDVNLAVLTGSHTSDTVEALQGATLHSLQFRPYCEDN